MAADDAGLTGLLIASRYRIGNRIGAGGMGIVHAAIDEQLRRQVAVKFLPSASQPDDDRLGRFRNEARTLSALNHPHIVTIFEIGQTENTPFIAMELVEGETLRARLRAGRLPLRDAVDIALQVARALGAAHAKGIVHRDIKPENVMIRRDGYVKVLDFGVARTRACNAIHVDGRLARDRYCRRRRHTGLRVARADRRPSTRCTQRFVLTRCVALRDGDGNQSLCRRGRRRHRQCHSADAGAGCTDHR